MSRKVKVLIADDAPEVACRLEQIISELEYAQVVGVAGDGRRALELYERQNPHIAVLDLQMPGLNGLELLKIIRARDPSVSVAILTNYDEEETRKRCLEAGANFFLHKPTEFEQIADIIKKLHQEINLK